MKYCFLGFLALFKSSNALFNAVSGDVPPVTDNWLTFFIKVSLFLSTFNNVSVAFVTAVLNGASPILLSDELVAVFLINWFTTSFNAVILDGHWYILVS